MTKKDPEFKLDRKRFGVLKQDQDGAYPTVAITCKECKTGLGAYDTEEEAASRVNRHVCPKDEPDVMEIEG